MMMRLRRRVIALAALAGCLLAIPGAASAQLPWPCQGWNYGNEMEATCGVGCWSGAQPTPQVASISLP